MNLHTFSKAVRECQNIATFKIIINFLFIFNPKNHRFLILSKKEKFDPNQLFSNNQFCSELRVKFAVKQEVQECANERQNLITRYTVSDSRPIVSPRENNSPIYIFIYIFSFFFLLVHTLFFVFFFQIECNLDCYKTSSAQCGQENTIIFVVSVFGEATVERFKSNGYEQCNFIRFHF